MTAADSAECLSERLLRQLYTNTYQASETLGREEIIDSHPINLPLIWKKSSLWPSPLLLGPFPRWKSITDEAENSTDLHFLLER